MVTVILDRLWSISLEKGNPQLLPSCNVSVKGNTKIVVRIQYFKDKMVVVAKQRTPLGCTEPFATEQIACIYFVSIFCRKSDDYSQKKHFCLTGEHMCLEAAIIFRLCLVNLWTKDLFDSDSPLRLLDFQGTIYKIKLMKQLYFPSISKKVNYWTRF